MRTALIVFLAVAVTVPATILGFEIIGGYSRLALSFAFLALLAFCTLALIVIAFWSKVFGLSPTIQTVSDSLLELVDAIAKRDSNAAKIPANSLILQAASLYSWAKTARAIVVITCSLLAAIAGFAATFIAVRQNELIQIQNEIADKQKIIGSIQNELLAKELALAERESVLLSSQERIADLQLKAMIDQNALTQATRQATFNSELSEILNQIANEFAIHKSYPDQISTTPLNRLPLISTWTLSQEFFSKCAAQKRTLPPTIKVVEHGKQDDNSISEDDLRLALSDSLVMRIILFSKITEPYTVLMDATGKTSQLSVERAKLFEALLLSRIWLPPILWNLDLSYADFREKTFVSCDFSGAKLAYANFDKARLSGCTFGKQDLSTTSFREASFYETKFSLAIVPDTKLMIDAKGLSARHFVGAFTANPNWLKEAISLKTLRTADLLTFSKMVLDRVCMVPFESGACGANQMHPAVPNMYVLESPGFAFTLESLKNERSSFECFEKAANVAEELRYEVIDD
jgi:uncharacterized protein YjbI with pentapeptide repeats